MTQIIDIDFEQSASGDYDISIQGNGDLKTVDGFDTALLMSLYCERRASSAQVPAPAKRRGWIGNQFNNDADFEIGSLLWLYEQQRLTSSLKNSVEASILEGLQWLIEDNYANKIEALTDFRGEAVITEITIFAINKPVETRNFELWKNTGVVL